MAEALVVVESPSKAKTIEKYLGKGYQVKASKGHIADLPKSGLGVDTEAKFAPEYEVMPGKQKILTELKQALKGKSRLVIAVDPDREGEAIGWHVANRLGLIDLKGKRKKTDIKLERITFTEITKSAVQEALAKPRDLDIHLLNAQQARRVLDRLVGYKLSPLLWKKIRFGLSAGRVQSVAVRLIVDREAERNKFKAEEYWTVTAILSEKAHRKASSILYYTEKEERAPELKASELPFNLQKINGKQIDLSKDKPTEEILKKLLAAAWKITNLEAKEVKRYPKPPFTTSTLQQTAANWFGYSAKRTMSIAQKLYEKGVITYMRTDSTSMSAQAIDAARVFLKAEYGDEYVPANPVYYRTKAKVAQEAHECVRPANFAETGSGLEKMGFAPEDIKLYKLIWERALASQMQPAILNSTAVTILVNEKGDDYEFRTTGQLVKFAGYTKVYPEKVSEVVLPQLAVGQELHLLRLSGEQHFTQPPARYSEATLIKELEKYGIGRPSTYAPIISTILQRKYVEKDGKYFFPTDTGIVVTKLLSAHFPEVVDTDFTAEMEEDLDQIAGGSKNWHDVLKNFYSPFSKLLAEKEAKIKRDDFTVLGDAPKEMKCPVDGAKMVIKLGKYGRFYSCSNFPDCLGMLNIDGTSEADLLEKPKTAEFQENYLPGPKTDDGREYLLKKGRYGEFWAHPDYPKVKDAQPLVLQPKKLHELYGMAPKTKDGRDYLFKSGKFGVFWAHPDYPKVKDTVRIKQAKPKEDNS